MKTHLPQDMLGTGMSAEFYADCIDSFSEDDYEKGLSDKLALHVVQQMKKGGGAPSADDKGQQLKRLSGDAFEFLIGEMLVMHGLVPFYTQAEIWKVPMSKVDFLLYDENEPVILTCKSSMAERWRQAAFEGIFLKHIYHRGRCYLVSADSNGVRKRNANIDEGEIEGIDRCFLAYSEEFKKFLEDLSAKRKFSIAKNVSPVSKQRCIVKEAAK